MMIRGLKTAIAGLCLFPIMLGGSVAQAADAIGLRDFRELPETLAEVTGIPLSDEIVRLALTRAEPQLPQTGDVAEMSAPMLMSVMDLSGAFCSRLVAKESVVSSGLRRVFKSVNFKEGPKQFTNAAAEQMLSQVAMVFWQRAMTPSEMGTMKQSVRDIVTGVANTPAETLNITQAACLSVASSIAFLSH